MCLLQFLTAINLIYHIYEAYSSAEMSAFKPAGGGFVRHATMWLDKSTGIAIGYMHFKSFQVDDGIHTRHLGGISGIL